jgi:hypothetical protein
VCVCVFLLPITSLTESGCTIYRTDRAQTREVPYVINSPPSIKLGTCRTGCILSSSRCTVCWNTEEPFAVPACGPTIATRQSVELSSYLDETPKRCLEIRDAAKFWAAVTPYFQFDGVNIKMKAKSRTHSSSFSVSQREFVVTGMGRAGASLSLSSVALILPKQNENESAFQVLRFLLCPASVARWIVYKSLHQNWKQQNNENVVMNYYFCKSHFCKDMIVLQLSIGWIFWEYGAPRKYFISTSGFILDNMGI